MFIAFFAIVFCFQKLVFFPRENWAVFRPRPICRRFDKSLLESWQLSVGQFAATGKLRRRAPCTVSPRSKRWAACTVFGAAVRTLFSLASFCHRLLRQVRVTSPLQLRTVVANSEQLRSRNPIKRGEPGDERLKLQKTKARRSQKVSVLKARKNALPTAQFKIKTGTLKTYAYHKQSEKQKMKTKTRRQRYSKKKKLFFRPVLGDPLPFPHY